MASGKKSRSIQGQGKTKSAKVTRHRHKGLTDKSIKAKKVRPMKNKKLPAGRLR